MADRVGQQLGNYRLLEVLGEGGFAEVYLGEHLYLKTRVAVKVLHTRLTQEDLDGFLTEAQTIARLIHPQIVRVLDFGVEGKTPFLVMDYAANGTLRTRHPKGSQLSEETMLPYVKQVAQALQYAHDEKLVHRDIKPENMLLGRRNEVLLSDFGIATVAQSSRYQGTQEVAGTVAYMAPEQVQGKPRPASDQYSLGIVVYEWLTGERPFHGSFSEIATQHLLVPPPPLREKLPTLSPLVEQVVLTALAKDPKERFASVQAFATALEQACQGEAAQFSPSPSLVSIPPPASPAAQPPEMSEDNILVAPTQITPPTPTVQEPTLAVPPERSPRESTAVLEVTLGHPSVSGSGAFAQSSRPASQASTMENALHLPPPAPAIPKAPPPVQKGLSRRKVVVGLAGLAVAGGVTWLVLSKSSPTGTQAAPPTPTATPVPVGSVLLTYQGNTNITYVAWSPNGKYLATGYVDSTVDVWDGTTGTKTITYRGHSANQYGIFGLAWSPDSQRIASGADDNTLQIWEATTGTPILTSRHSSAVGAVAWSPSGGHIALSILQKAEGTQILDSSTGSILLTLGDQLVSGNLSWSPDSMRVVTWALFEGAVFSPGIEIWDATTGQKLLTHVEGAHQESTVAWSPVGQQIASASDQGTIEIWDATTGNTLLTYPGEKAVSFAWSPDGKRIASANQTVQIWDAATGTTLFTFQGYFATQTALMSLAWSSDGKRIASTGPHDTIQIWQAQ